MELAMPDLDLIK